MSDCTGLWISVVNYKNPERFCHFIHMSCEKAIEFADRMATFYNVTKIETFQVTMGQYYKTTLARESKVE